MPQAETPPTYGPVTPIESGPTVAPKKPKIPLWAFISAGLFAVLLVALIVLGGDNASYSDVEPTPTPGATVSATPTRVLSAIATQSAFTKFETDLDSLARGIQNTQTQNQQLLPPRLELPLGF